MARVTITHLECEVCETKKGVKQFWIAFSSRGSPGRYDLCEEHAAPLWELRAAKLGKRTDGRRRRVVVSDE